MATLKPLILHLDSPSKSARRRCGLTKDIRTASLHGHHLNIAQDAVDIHKPPESSSDESTGSDRQAKVRRCDNETNVSEQTGINRESDPLFVRPHCEAGRGGKAKKRNIEHVDDFEPLPSQQRAKTKSTYGSRKRPKTTSNIHTDPASRKNLSQKGTAPSTALFSNAKPKFNLPPTRECTLSYRFYSSLANIHLQHQANRSLDLSKSTVEARLSDHNLKVI